MSWHEASENMDEGAASVALSYANNFEGCGASGFNICADLILTHGSLLNVKVTSTPEIDDFIENMTAGEVRSVPMSLRENLKVRVYRQREAASKIDKENRKMSTRFCEKSVENSSLEIVEAEGSVIAAWKCPLLDNTFREVLSGWSFDKTRKNERSLLPIFVIVQLDRKNRPNISLEKEASRARRALNRFVERIDHPLMNPPRGASLEILSTPFGNPVFINSASRGVVSNVFGDDGCIMLTDANAVPGSEGAPIYVIQTENKKSCICGMVIAPLSWCRGEWVDYTFAANLLPCLRSLLRSRCLDRYVDEPKSRIADLVDQSLVLVRCGGSWGTGIIFDAGTGTIITCSHVVRKAPESRIKVVLRRGDDSVASGSSPTSSSSSSSSSWAKLLYRTAEEEPYDVAVLKLDPRDIEPMLRSIKIATRQSAFRGELVASAGFPFFSSRFPTITRGNVSAISDCMLRTTCCVQSGSSGGPIVRWSNGEMLGMVVCNAIAKNETKLYPRLNMAVPVSILEPPISEYLRTGEVKALDALGNQDLGVKRTWNFYRLPSSKI
ncbi:peroxisomal leader peptide-processing protease isoform X2 [Venturia canescens]|uniref:peroxisomal leader peptide-processing protease isoform X2 n=1 Tax=Venturia canescens TaxID=32260 RepID=UPI001C9CA5EF|nr:peroxisomal leader peptide-processing protease isoform X2 [Venturia canescens]